MDGLDKLVVGEEFIFDLCDDCAEGSIQTLQVAALIQRQVAEERDSWW
jgi:hypothetical protein